MKISHDAAEDQNEKRLKALSIGRSAFWIASGLSIGGLLLAIMIALGITRNISRSINQLKLSTWEISEGKFGILPEVHNQDELGDLSQAFHRMAERLKCLEEMCLDANPLTHLPGSVAIESVLNKRLKENTPLAFCQLDLSHFKAFNDRYGYARGNEVIQATARILTEAVHVKGDEGTFAGHIGGDDFVVIALPERCEKICLAIIGFLRHGGSTAGIHPRRDASGTKCVFPHHDSGDCRRDKPEPPAAKSHPGRRDRSGIEELCKIFSTQHFCGRPRQG